MVVETSLGVDQGLTWEAHLPRDAGPVTSPVVALRWPTALSDHLWLWTWWMLPILGVSLFLPLHTVLVRII